MFVEVFLFYSLVIILFSFEFINFILNEVIYLFIIANILPSNQILDCCEKKVSWRWLTEAVSLGIELQIERNDGYRIKMLNNIQDGSYAIDAAFMTV